jgi:hypothetical protein
MKYFPKKILATVAGFMIASTALAADATFQQDVTAAFTAGNCTIKSGSTANSVSIDGNVLILVQGASQDFTIDCPTTVQLTTTPNVGELCVGGNRRYQQSSGQLLTTTFNAAAVTTACGSTTGNSGSGGGGGGGGGGSSGSTVTVSVTNSVTMANGTQPYLQLPEADDANPVVGTDKNAKFPSSGRVTQKTTLKNAAGDAFVLVQGVRVKKANGKKYTGFVTAPKSLSVDTLTAAVPAHAKLPAGTLLKAVTVVFDEQVKMDKSMQLKFSVPKVTKKTKFKVFYFNEKTKKWVSAGKAIIGADKNTVFVNTKAQGMFILLQK